MSTDFIVKLLESKGYVFIIVAVDRMSGQVHCVPTHKVLDTDGHVQTYICKVFRHHGTPKQMIFNCRLVFAFKFLKAIYNAVGVKPAMSTVYYPQTDGKTEWINTEIEQYLALSVSIDRIIGLNGSLLQNLL